MYSTDLLPNTHLISIGQLEAKGLEFTLKNGKCFMFKQGALWAVANRESFVYYLENALPTQWLCKHSLSLGSTPHQLSWQNHYRAPIQRHTERIFKNGSMASQARIFQQKIHIPHSKTCRRSGIWWISEVQTGLWRLHKGEPIWANYNGLSSCICAIPGAPGRGNIPAR